MRNIVLVIFIVTALSQWLGNWAFRAVIDAPENISYFKYIFYFGVVHIFLWPELLLELFVGSGNLSELIRVLAGLLGWGILICIFYFGLKWIRSSRGRGVIP